MIAAIAAAALLAAAAPHGERVTCAQQSIGEFETGYADASNLVAGPLALIGGGTQPTEALVRRLGGSKFPAVVTPGHRVTVAVSRRARRVVALTHGSGPRTLARGFRALTFKSCSEGKAGSRAAGRRVTFWPSFVVSAEPRCVHLKIWVDDRPRPYRRQIALGRPCG